MLEIKTKVNDDMEEIDVKVEKIIKEMGEKKDISIEKDLINIYIYIIKCIQCIDKNLKEEEYIRNKKIKDEKEMLLSMYYKWEQKLNKELTKLETEQRGKFKEYMYAVKMKQNMFSYNTKTLMQEYMTAYLQLLELEQIKPFLKYKGRVCQEEFKQIFNKNSVWRNKNVKIYYDSHLLNYEEIFHEVDASKALLEIGNEVALSSEDLANLKPGEMADTIDEYVNNNYLAKKDGRLRCINKFLEIEQVIECCRKRCLEIKDKFLKKNEEGIKEVINDTEQCLKKYEYEMDKVYEKLEHEIERFEKQQLNEINDLNRKYEEFIRTKIDEKDYFECKCHSVLNEYIKPHECSSMYNIHLNSYVDVAEYKCPSNISEDVLLGWLQVNCEREHFNNSLKEILGQDYNCYYRFDKFNLPYVVRFDERFNMLLEMKSENARVKNIIRNILLKILMTNSPRKVNLTLFDTIESGETFAMFTRIVSPDDRTNKIINGQIWTQQKDMQEKLEVTVSHISNVVQRCLQGKYEDVLTYNMAAKQNAEPYNILTIMDFPANFNEQMLKNLERIVVNGAKCGVFTIIIKNKNEMEKLDSRLRPLAEEICNLLNKWHIDKEQIKFEREGKIIEEFSLNLEQMPEGDELDKILLTLKEGIKNADKIMIEYDDSITIDNNEMMRGSTLKGIRVPIGVYGVDETQYLTLGVGGAQHALIAGQTGSGKSSLLHTIITSSLQQYSEDELNIYLVDFKRGVEFKLYANYILPVFKVIAVESEKEFGFNVLEHLDREQKIRADLFKKNKDVSDIEEYRNTTKKAMPRILVIIDEFHELFSSESDTFSKKAAVYLERVVRQGRAFGIHIILASQSLSNISGINKAVLDQISVRIALKCSSTDANMLLEDGENIIKQIAIDDPGKAIYNSEGGNKTVNTEFRALYLQPEKHKTLLEEISSKTENKDFSSTRILLNNVEDNPNNIFNRFNEMKDIEKFKGHPLFLGETVSITNNMNIEFENEKASNLLIVGSDDEKARNMFVFSVLSLCISSWLKNGRKAPKQPIVYLMNFKPLEDSYFKDMLELEGTLLNKYVRYSSFRDSEKEIVELYEHLQSRNGTEESEFLLVYGLQNANVLKNDSVAVQRQELMRGLPSFLGGNEEQKSTYQMFEDIMIYGPQSGVHSIIWHDNYTALDVSERTLISYFDMRIGFNMSKDEYSQFVNENNLEVLNDNNAIYYNRIRYNQRFRPYQAPDEDWMRKICGLIEN